MDEKQKYLGACAALAVIGVVLGQWLVGRDVGYVPAEGVSVFAVLYVLAQGVERVVEVTIAVVDLVTPPAFAESKKQTALKQMRTALAADRDADVSSDKGEVDEARQNLSILAAGLGFGLAYAVVSYFGIGILAQIGVLNLEPGVDRVFTAMAIMGGSKGLHELIGRLQKSKEAAEAH